MNKTDKREKAKLIVSDEICQKTLMEASEATAFTYKVEGDNVNDMLVNELNDEAAESKTRDTVSSIYDKGLRLHFNGNPNAIFHNNLVMIDSRLPDILAWLMLDVCLSGVTNLQEETDAISKANPMNFPLQLGNDHYGFKLKSFLVALALGMQADKTWNGKDASSTGYTMTEEDGKVFRLPHYDRNALGDYIFKNAVIRTIFIYGVKIYKGNFDSYYIDLYLQILFKRPNIMLPPIWAG